MKSSIRFKKGIISKYIFTLIMCIVTFAILIPILWMISTSLKVQGDVFKFPIEWIPKTFNISNYFSLFTEQYPFHRFFLNSLIITSACVIGNLITSSLAAYGFARLDFKGRDLIFLFYLGTLMIPFHVLMVPRFLLFKTLGIYNTYWALILPGIFNVLGVFLLKQFFMSVPFELSQSAKIDGANEFETYSRIILPLAKPGLTSLAILTFVWRWNDYEAPLIFLTKRELYTVPLGLTLFIDESGVQIIPLIMAAAFLSILPILLIFLLGQKFFISGIIAGSIKG